MPSYVGLSVEEMKVFYPKLIKINEYFTIPELETFPPICLPSIRVPDARPLQKPAWANVHILTRNFLLTLQRNGVATWREHGLGPIHTDA